MKRVHPSWELCPLAMFSLEKCVILLFPKQTVTVIKAIMAPLGKVSTSNKIGKNIAYTLIGWICNSSLLYKMKCC